MIDEFSFTIKYSNKKTIFNQKIVFSSGLNLIYGESGVGKSELGYLLSGLSSSAQSRFEIIDQSIESDIHLVPQNPDQQIIGNSILNELSFNLESLYRNSIDIENELETLIKELLFDVDLERHPATLSGGEKELLNIATARSLQQHVLILDDSLSFLSNKMKSKVVEKLIKDNLIILWFTSDCNDLEYSTSIWEMTANSIQKIQKIPGSNIQKAKLIDGEIGLQASYLNFAYNSNEVFSDLNISMEQFRCLGFVGENGCGKSTLASLLLDVEKPRIGSIDLIGNNNKLINIGFLDQFPERLIGINTIDEFVAKLRVNNILNELQIPVIIQDLEKLNIGWENINSIPGNRLSWTELRIALIGILANCNYDVLILDEPTFGMGQNQKNKIRSYLIRYLEKKHLILISHDKFFLESMCDEIVEL